MPKPLLPSHRETRSVNVELVTLAVPIVAAEPGDKLMILGNHCIGVDTGRDLDSVYQDLPDGMPRSLRERIASRQPSPRGSAGDAESSHHRVPREPANRHKGSLRVLRNKPSASQTRKRASPNSFLHSHDDMRHMIVEYLRQHGATVSRDLTRAMGLPLSERPNVTHRLQDLIQRGTVVVLSGTHQSRTIGLPPQANPAPAGAQTG